MPCFWLANQSPSSALYGTSDGIDFLLVEFLDGETLHLSQQHRTSYRDGLLPAGGAQTTRLSVPMTVSNELPMESCSM